jgi:hypothetical protein
MTLVDPSELSTGDLVAEINEWTTLIRSSGWRRFLEHCAEEYDKLDAVLDQPLINLDAVPGQEWTKGMRKMYSEASKWPTMRLEQLNEQLDFIKENEDGISANDSATG